MPLLTVSCSLRHLLRSLLCCLLVIATAADAAADKPLLEAPTFEEVAKAIDLRKFKLPKGPKKDVRRQLANVSFYVAGDQDELCKDLEKQLLAMGCKKVVQGDKPENNSFRTFEKDGFLIHAAVYLNDEGKVRVTIENRGKTDLSKLPNFVSEDPNDSSFSATRSFGDQSIETAIDQVKLLLQADGFEHLATTNSDRLAYSGKRDPRFIQILMRKNTTLLSVYATRELTPTEHTRVAITSDIDSVGFPIPPDTQSVFCYPKTGNASIERKWKAEQIVKFYNDELSKRSWSKLQNDPRDVDFSNLPDREADGSYIEETFGKANEGRIVVKGFRDTNQEGVFRIWVTYESAEDFFNSD